MKKIAAFIIGLFFIATTHAQNDDFTMDGFHLSVVGQLELHLSNITISTTGDYPPPPLSSGIYGWETGVEVSYNFCKYLGVTTGLEIGTGLTYRLRAYYSQVPDGNGGTVDIYKYGKAISHADYDLFIPLIFEFHYPVAKNIFFTANAGIKLKGFLHHARYKGNNNNYTITLMTDYDSRITNPVPYFNAEINPIPYYPIAFDILSSAGIYYVLPYKDLLRFSIGFNFSCFHDFHGSYTYLTKPGHGALAGKHDHLYLQVGYVHCFKTKKQKK